MAKVDEGLLQTYQQLLAAARNVAEHAYAPYTNKPQGAAVLTASGEIFCGVTVELCTFSFSSAAEINALTQAVAQGHRSFKAIAIFPYNHPSGTARQFIAEFGIDVDLIGGSENNLQVIPLKDLLPYHFGPANLAV